MLAVIIRLNEVLDRLNTILTKRFKNNIIVKSYKIIRLLDLELVFCTMLTRKKIFIYVCTGFLTISYDFINHA